MSGSRPRWAGPVGLLGDLLITLGALLGLFVVWQLWWTDVEAAAKQADIVAAFQQEADDAAPPPRVDTPDPAPVDLGPPPVPDVPPEAETFALLRVPRWGPDYLMPISEGVARSTVLDVKGIGHYADTAMPGQVGNFALAGHRQTYGRPFYGVHELELGDPLVVQTDGAWYVYRVTATRVVNPRQVEVIAPRPGLPDVEPTEAYITLTTCHPLFSTRERFVVHGELESWLPTSHGYPDALGSEIIDRLTSEA